MLSCMIGVCGNCPGSMEWSGDWSDTSPLWTKEMQVTLRNQSIKEVG